MRIEGETKRKKKTFKRESAYLKGFGASSPPIDIPAGKIADLAEDEEEAIAKEGGQDGEIGGIHIHLDLIRTRRSGGDPKRREKGG